MTSDNHESLVERVARLEETQAAINILHSFAASLDAPDVDTVLELFTTDAVLVSPSRTARGHAEIGEFFRTAWAADPSSKRHFVMSPRTTWLEPGRVRLEAYFYFIGRMPDSSVLGWGTYDDIVDVSGPVPQFAEIQMATHLRTDLDSGWATAVPAASATTAPVR